MIISNDLRLEVLTKARERGQQGWCQYYSAVDDHRTAVSAISEYAVRWCIIGLITCEVYKLTKESDNRLQLVADVVSYFQRNGLPDRDLDCCVAFWNDRSGRTKEEVIAAFDRAILSLQIAMEV